MFTSDAPASNPIREWQWPMLLDAELSPHKDPEDSNLYIWRNVGRYDVRLYLPKRLFLDVEDLPKRIEARLSKSKDMVQGSMHVSKHLKDRMGKIEPENHTCVYEYFGVVEHYFRYRVRDFERGYDLYIPKLVFQDQPLPLRLVLSLLL